jgi:diguanylate cyclase (GGDEF)-like protein
MKIVEQLSITDELTGIYNRRHFNKLFQEELKNAFSEKQPLSFFMFDIDHFKQYNDYYGHQKGDDVLKTIGIIMKAQKERDTDLFFRLGGEEFGVLFSREDEESSILYDGSFVPSQSTR